MSLNEKCVDCNNLFWDKWDLTKNKSESTKQNFLKKRFEILCQKCSEIKLFGKKSNTLTIHNTNQEEYYHTPKIVIFERPSYWYSPNKIERRKQLREFDRDCLK